MTHDVGTQIPQSLPRGQFKPGSQNDRIMEILHDGHWHLSSDLHRRVMCVLHSRIAEINKAGLTAGFRVEHRGGGSGAENHEYRLTTTSGAESPQSLAVRAADALDTTQGRVDTAAVSLSAPGAEVIEADGHLPTEPTAPAYIAGQLSIDELVAA